MSANPASASNDESSNNGERVLPSWMKRAPSQHDIKEVDMDNTANNAPNSVNKAKKKPKLF
jgi:hypothetical protein